jgi:hypothetical protein
MTQSEPILKIRYSPKFGYIQIAIGIIGCITQAVLLKQPFNIIGLILIIGGSLMLSRPFLILYEDRLVAPALLGPVKRSYYFLSYSSISIQGKKLYVQTITKGIKKFSLKDIHKEDLSKLKSLIELEEIGIEL